MKENYFKGIKRNIEFVERNFEMIELQTNVFLDAPLLDKGNGNKLCSGMNDKLNIAMNHFGKLCKAKVNVNLEEICDDDV